MSKTSYTYSLGNVIGKLVWTGYDSTSLNNCDKYTLSFGQKWRLQWGIDETIYSQPKDEEKKKKDQEGIKVRIITKLHLSSPVWKNVIVNKIVIQYKSVSITVQEPPPTQNTLSYPSLQWYLSSSEFP